MARNYRYSCEYEPDSYECDGCGEFRPVFDRRVRNEATGEMEDKVYCASCWAKSNNALAELIERMTE